MLYSYYGSKEQVPRNIDVYAYAYSTTSKKESMFQKQEPVLGQVNDHGTFIEKRKNGTFKTKGVYAYNRRYASTLEEAIQGYNEEINNEIQRLLDIVEKHKNNKLKLL